MISLKISPERKEYISQEEIEVLIKITNNEPNSIQLPDPDISTSTQPTYSLTGPGYPEGITFNNFSLSQAAGDEGDPEIGPAGKMITIEPGVSWEGLISLNSAADLSLPGEYRLQARLAWQGVKVKSQEALFRIEQMKPISIHLGMGIRPLEYGEGEGGIIHKGTDSKQLYVFMFLEDHPGIGEANLNAPISLLTLGPKATDIVVPWRNSPFFNESVRWFVWREERHLKALHNASTTPISFELPDEISGIVRPPLKTTGGPIEILAVSKDKMNLYLVMIADYRTNQKPPAQLAWQVPLPLKPHTITAALAPEQLGSDRHIAISAKHNDGFAILHSSYKENGTPKDFRTVVIENAKLLDNAQVALYIDSEKTIHTSILSFLKIKGKKAYRCAIVEARFEPTGSVVVETNNLGTVNSKPIGGAIFYVDNKHRITDRKVVISLEDKQVLSLNTSGFLAPIPVTGQPTVPMLLAPGQMVTYLLTFDPEHGLNLDPL